MKDGMKEKTIILASIIAQTFLAAVLVLTVTF